MLSIKNKSCEEIYYVADALKFALYTKDCDELAYSMRAKVLNDLIEVRGYSEHELAIIGASLIEGKTVEEVENDIKYF